MTPDLHDNSWMQVGTSLLWDAAALNSLCAAGSIRSLRELLRLHQSGWPDSELKLINNRTLVVSGLESVMDTLHPEHAEEWLEKTVYPAVLDFQENVADGGREAALILWLAEAKRIWHRPADHTYHWHCTGAHRNHSIPIGRCLWNGAEGSARRIITFNSEKKEVYVGLFHPRIS